METNQGNINYKKGYKSLLGLTANIKAWIVTVLIIGIPGSLIYKAIKDSPKVIQVSIENKTRNGEKVMALPSNYKEIADSLNKIVIEHGLGNIATSRKKNYVTYTLENKDYDVGMFEEIIYTPQKSYQAYEDYLHDKRTRDENDRREELRSEIENASDSLSNYNITTNIEESIKFRDGEEIEALPKDYRKIASESNKEVVQKKIIGIKKSIVTYRLEHLNYQIKQNPTIIEKDKYNPAMVEYVIYTPQ